MKSATETIQEQVESERLLESVLRRINARVLGITLGGLCAIALFFATNLLILKGGEHPGEMLVRLCWYMPGYSMTFFPGSILGAFWAFAYGFVGGEIISRVYNLVAGARRKQAPRGSRG
jgi:hypothetical protein